MLSNVALKTKTSDINIGNVLAGNIKNQCEAVFDNAQREMFLTTIYEHVKNALKEFDNDHHLIWKDGAENLTFNMGGGPWINFQKAGEFNPYHSHSGQLSAVIYIDVPEEIAKENTRITIATNSPCHGKIAFIHGSEGYATDSSFNHQPKTGELFIFPSVLKHLVYPFFSDVERISMSFNLYNINVE